MPSMLGIIRGTASYRRGSAFHVQKCILLLMRSILLASLLLLSAHPFRAFCEEVPAEDASAQSLAALSLEELMNIEVTTASKKPENRSEVPAAILVLTQNDIRCSGATTVAEALRLVPGVHVAKLDSSRWVVAVRGFNDYFSKKLLVLQDGRSVYSPLYGGVYWQPVELVLDDVERIEVIRGPGGTLWGSNAVNSVINIITKDKGAW